MIMETKIGPTGMETLTGSGKAMGVIMQDGSRGVARARLVPIKEYHRLLELQGDEVGLLTIYCEVERPLNLSPAIGGLVTSSPSGGGLVTSSPTSQWVAAGREWVEALAPESHELLIEEGERLNADFFGRWVARQMKRLERVNPRFAERVASGEALRSPSSPPASPRSLA